MSLAELDEHEQLVLMGLVKLVVHADQIVSPEEKQVLAQLQAALGPAVWNERVRQASASFPTVAELEAAAHQVTRPEAQQAIHEVLDQLAGSDELIEAEAHVLEWLDQAWGLTGSHDDDDDDDDDGDDDAVESFVLMDDG
jgi:hypothetical protein